jgi:hypothetical protein
MHSLLRCREKIEFTSIGHFSGARIDHARNEVVKRFIASDCDRLLFVDSDMVFGPSHMRRILEHDRPIVAGLYFIGSQYKCHPTILQPTADGERVKEWKRGELVEADSTGCGFLLVKREVFATLRGPSWFKWTDTLGEDVYFCHLARKAGFPVVVDTSIQLGHVKVKPITLADFDGVSPREQNQRADYFPE